MITKSLPTASLESKNAYEIGSGPAAAPFLDLDIEEGNRSIFYCSLIVTLAVGYILDLVLRCTTYISNRELLTMNHKVHRSRDQFVANASFLA